jgi:uncharacterized RDD family membrane protein YckC
MTLPDEMLSIDTPENVAFGYSVAGIGSRFLAALVDSTLIVLLQLIVIVISTFALNAANLVDTLGSWLSAIFGLLAFLLFWGYYIFFEMLWNGQSPGKRWVGLRVIRVDGTPVTLAESIIRNLVRLIDFMPFGYGVGVVTMFVNDQARRLGDLAAGSLVVHDGGQLSIQSITRQRIITPVSGQLPALDPALPLERLQPEDIQLLEDFLSRRFLLSNAQALSTQILKRVYTHMGLEPPQGPAQPDQHLAALLQAVRSRYDGKNNNNRGQP